MRAREQVAGFVALALERGIYYGQSGGQALGWVTCAETPTPQRSVPKVIP